MERRKHGGHWIILNISVFHLHDGPRGRPRRGDDDPMGHALVLEEGDELVPTGQGGAHSRSGGHAKLQVGHPGGHACV